MILYLVFVVVVGVVVVVVLVVLHDALNASLGKNLPLVLRKKNCSYSLVGLSWEWVLVEGSKMKIPGGKRAKGLEWFLPLGYSSF